MLSEYRIPLTVDGKPIGKPEQDAIKLFGRLAKARSTAEELEVLKEQNVSHRLRVVAWGMTQPPSAPFARIGAVVSSSHCKARSRWTGAR